VVTWGGVAASPPEPPDPRVGSVLQGRYRLDAELASGAMGVVYRGERLQLGRPVAVKFLHPWIATQKAFLARFETEARAMSRLQHPNCVSVIDFGVEGTPYLVMDFITGKTLRAALAGGRLEPARALRLARQLLAGLGYAHAQGIIHRDLKPENLILGDEPGLADHLRILDFGLAKLRDGPAMTAGLAVGTPSYMSPEQTGADGAIDARTDLYAVGVVLFEMLAGRKPFQSENVGELLLMHREQPPPLLRAAAPAAGLSAELEAVVGKALLDVVDRLLHPLDVTRHRSPFVTSWF
jgi:serine/threonine protein kinase